MAEPKDMVVPMLREMREHIDKRFAADVRLGRIETAQASYKAALTADTLMSKLLTGDFEIRIKALEREIAALKAGH